MPPDRDYIKPVDENGETRDAVYGWDVHAARHLKAECLYGHFRNAAQKTANEYVHGYNMGGKRGGKINVC